MQSAGEDGDAIFGAFAIADDNLVLGKIDILDAQTQTFHEAKAAAIEELGHEEMNAGHVGENPLHFVPREDSGQALGLFGGRWA